MKVHPIWQDSFGNERTGFYGLQQTLKRRNKQWNELLKDKRITEIKREGESGYIFKFEDGQVFKCELWNFEFMRPAERSVTDKLMRNFGGFDL